MLQIVLLTVAFLFKKNNNPYVYIYLICSMIITTYTNINLYYNSMTYI